MAVLVSTPDGSDVTMVESTNEGPKSLESGLVVLSSMEVLLVEPEKLVVDGPSAEELVLTVATPEVVELLDDDVCDILDVTLKVVFFDRERLLVREDEEERSLVIDESCLVSVPVLTLVPIPEFEDDF